MNNLSKTESADVSHSIAVARLVDFWSIKLMYKTHDFF